MSQHDIEQKVIDYIETHQDELYQTLSKLLQFDSQNFITWGRERPCQEYIQTLFEEIGLETDLYSVDDIPGIKEHPGYLAGRGMEDRPNVTGICYGKNRDERIMLAAHTDTMPTGDLSAWTVDPFGGEIKDGRIYGLGSGDNKFGTAVGYFVLKALKELGIFLEKTVVLTAYSDEEYGGGDGALGAVLKYSCDTYVNFDGGNYEMWTAALGGCVYKMEVQLNGTTDTAEPVVDAMHEIKAILKPFFDRRRAELHANPLYTGSDMERSASRIMRFACGNSGSDLNIGHLEFVIYTDSTKEQIDVELAEKLSEIEAMLAGRNMTTKGFIPGSRFFLYGETEPNCEAVNIMTDAAAEAIGHSIKTCGACLSDLSVFRAYGSPRSFNFGILRDFALYGGAHQPDEFVECEQFKAHAKATALFLLRYAKIAN